MSSDLFRVEVGKGPKGRYNLRFGESTIKSETQAILLYRGINIGFGYKKRLVKNGKVIAREFS